MSARINEGTKLSVFGFTAALLESVPIAGLVFSISNRVGAAMWAHGMYGESVLATAVGKPIHRSGEGSTLRSFRTGEATLALPFCILR